MHDKKVAALNPDMKPLLKEERNNKHDQQHFAHLEVVFFQAKCVCGRFKPMPFLVFSGGFVTVCSTKQSMLCEELKARDSSQQK